MSCCAGKVCPEGALILGPGLEGQIQCGGGCKGSQDLVFSEQPTGLQAQVEPDVVGPSKATQAETDTDGGPARVQQS